MEEKTIGALARFTGVSVHTIKYYEKLGLISANRQEHSNYRSYDVRVCTNIYECIKYRNLDFSLKDTAVLLKDADNEDLDRMLERRGWELEKEIEQLKARKALLNAYREEIRILDRCLGQWYIESIPHLYLKKQTVNLEYGEGTQMEAGNLMKEAPEMKNIVCLSQNYLNGGEQEFSWGCGAFFPEEHPEMEEEGLIHVKTGRAFVAYMRLTGSYVSNGEMVKEVRKIFCQYAHDAVFPSEAYGVRIKIVHDDKNRDWNYFKLVIPLV